ncbi:MAG TPA: hypothetical protein PKK26_07670 [Candidatus Wallbacteria bacterium]|nr:hypothetical protein [Candidatus Wallbacteria bacterium]
MKKFSILIIMAALSIFSFGITTSFAETQSDGTATASSILQELKTLPIDQLGRRPLSAFKFITANYNGYAITGEENFELAKIFIKKSDFTANQTSDTLEINGTINIGEQKYLIMDAKIEFEEAKTMEAGLEKKAGEETRTMEIGFNQRPGRDRKAPPMIKKIKSCEAKIAKLLEKMNIEKEKPEAIGEIKFSTIEKSSDAMRKKSVIYGTVSTDTGKYSLYLEATMQPFQLQHRQPQRGGNRHDRKPGARPQDQGQTQNDTTETQTTTDTQTDTQTDTESNG